MMTNFKPQTIGDLFSLTNGFAFPSKEFVSTGIPVLKIKNVKAGEMRFDDLSYVDRRFLSERAEKIAKRSDLLITMSGNRLDGTPETWVGKVAEFNRHEPYLVNQRVGILRAHPNVGLVPRYFAYALSSPEYQKLFISIATSSGGQANLSPSQILSAPVDVPELNVQEAIAEAVGSLDDKIEQNRRTGAKLEGLARAVFKAWFVDFEPVKAKAAGATAFPGMPPETFAALPTTFEDSDLGPVPDGWEVGTLPQVADVNYGKNLPASKLTQSGVAVYGAAGMVGFYSEMMFDQPVILITSRGSGSGAVHETFGLAFVTNNSFSVVPREKWFSRHYLKFWLRSVDLLARVTGSAQPQLTLANLQSLDVLNPMREMLLSFNAVVDPLWELENANRNESAKLATLRDYLLPRLLSGQVRVKDAAAQVQEVT